MLRHPLPTRRRWLLVTTLVAIAALVFAAAAYAVSSSVSPESQTAHSGDVVSWNASWSGASPFDVYFDYGDNTYTHLGPNTGLTSHQFKHQFYPCYDTTYTQTLQVEDNLHLYSVSQAQTLVYKGTVC